MDLYYYYNLLDNNKIAFDVQESEVAVDLKLLDKCKIRSIGFKPDSCYTDFYRKYTIVNGPEKALSHLSTMMLNDTTIVPGCHYITHGIGEGTYLKNKKDLGQSFAFDVSKNFKNVGSCGNGFYHGISIGLTRDTKTPDGLYTKLLDFCEEKTHYGGLGFESCTHGVGHAVTLYFNHDRTLALNFCDRLFAKDISKVFGCYTGTMMEYGVFVDYTGLLSGPGVAGLIQLCAEFAEGSKKREACIIEGAGTVRGPYSQNYVAAATECQILPNRLERKACTKLTVLQAVRLGRSQEAKLVCRVLKKYEDEIECTAFFAVYLARAVDLKRGSLFDKVSNDACHTLNYLGYVKCYGLVKKNLNTFTSDRNFGIFPDLKDWKIFFKKNILF